MTSDELGATIVGCGTVLLLALGLLALLAAIASQFGCGSEIVMHKSTPSPEVVLIHPPEQAAEVRTLREVPDGVPVFTVSSEVDTEQTGKHRVGDSTRNARLYWAEEPLPGPTWAPLVPFR